MLYYYHKVQSSSKMVEPFLYLKGLTDTIRNQGVEVVEKPNGTIGYASKKFPSTST